MIAALLTLVGQVLAQPAPPAASPGTEFVIVLDNSCSMVEPHTTDEGERRPAADPDRRAVLGAQIVDGLTRGTDDHLSVLGFPLRGRQGVLELDDSAAIREARPSAGTWFRGPLERARKILESTGKRDRMLLILSDGVPNDYDRPADGRDLLGLDRPSTSFDTLVLGLFPDEAPEAEAFMQALAREPADYHRVDDGAEVVAHFTRGYARALGSLALTGTLQPGQSTRFEVGRYVTEVLAVTTTVERTGPYEAELSSGGRSLEPRAEGDNGCSWRPSKNPTYCDAPRMHYRVWRAAHDPGRTTPFTLQVPRAAGEVGYGVILRYDLLATVDATEQAKIDTPSPVRARLTWNGETFDDPAFFERDDFRATARVAGEDIPMEHVGGGVFEGHYTPRTSRPLPVEVTFTNTWMRKSARGRLAVVKPPPLEIRGDALDFGAWRGGRWSTTSCRELTLDSNHSFDRTSVSFDFAGLPDGASLDVEPHASGWTVCARAVGCCGDLLSTDASALVVRATDTEGSEAKTRVPVRFEVARTGFLRCWGPWICALLTLLVLFWFLYGWIRPHDFDEDLTVRIAGSERTLSRSAALVLREQPRGRRGFYRNARVALTAGGDFVAKTRQAAFWVEATGAGDTRIHLQGPLEVKDRRTKQWRSVTEEEADDGLRTNIVYRLGDTYFRFQ